ncbi:MAG: nucleotidyltransferase family protein [Bacilli bacterium]|nr:nucleotidyltransferase family protein [Bacilli bacterium]
MKCILLCAGYATRLFPLTENYPKALLEIEEGKPLLNYTVEEINRLKEIEEIYLITNDRFYKIFKEWSESLNNEKPITIINDHTLSNDDRLGAIGDIQYTINSKNISDDVLIISGDNLFEFNLREALDFYYEKKAPVVGGQYENDEDLLTRLGVIEADENGKIVGFEEKPPHPKGNIKSLGIYIYPKHIVSVLKQYLEEGNKPDAPGYFLSYLYQKEPVYVFSFKGNWFDVGTHEALAEVRELYKNKN